jgi:hypothetical protein
MRSRVSQYVYVPTRDHLFQTLDLHADTLEGDVKLPLVLVGYEGNSQVLEEEISLHLYSDIILIRRSYLRRLCYVAKAIFDPK